MKKTKILIITALFAMMVAMTGIAAADTFVQSPISKIVISGSSTTTLTVGGNQTFTAIALDQGDHPLQGINISWTVSNSSVGNVDSPNGITNITGGATSTFTALVAGTTKVNATNGLS